MVFEGQEATEKAFQSGRCDAYTTDASGIAAMLVSMPDKGDYSVLPDLISKEPLGPMLRRNDQEFFAIARWMIYALQQAEESGVTAANVAQMKKESKDPTVQRLTGATGEVGKGLGLDADWAVRAIAAVGNYGESYDRHIKPLGFARAQCPVEQGRPDVPCAHGLTRAGALPAWLPTTGLAERIAASRSRFGEGVGTRPHAHHRTIPPCPLPGRADRDQPGVGGYRRLPPGPQPREPSIRSASATCRMKRGSRSPKS